MSVKIRTNFVAANDIQKNYSVEAGGYNVTDANTQKLTVESLCYEKYL